MILLVVGLVAVLVVVLIAVILSIRLGRGDEHDEPDIRPRSRDRGRADEDERWRDRDARRASSASARAAGRATDPGGRRGSDHPGPAGRGPARERDRAARGREYEGAPRRPARTEAPGYRQSAAARPPVPASAQARGRYDTGPQRRPAADDFPSGDYPSTDSRRGGAYPSGDHPSADFPAADYDTADHPGGRSQSRRKSASGTGKSRSRRQGKRGDDDDWPSTEWDKLSDEQYWAELSADKPLSAMAKPSRSASASGARAPVNGNAKRVAAPPAAREPRPAKREPRPGTAAARPARDVPSRNERTEPREPITERLPVRARQQPPAPAARRDTDRPGAGSYAPEPRSVRDTGPHAQRDPLRDGAPRARRDTGPQQHPEQPRRSATGPNPVRDRERDLAMLAGLVSAPPPIPGALEDDPLTSPSFSLKADTATDSRSYGNGRKHAKTTGQSATPAHRNGNGNGGYPPPDYASPDHAYQATPPAPRPSAAPAPAEQWYSAPAEAPAPAYGNPYQHPGPGTTAPPAGSQATAAHDGYPADPLRVYSPSAYEPPAEYTEPASPAYQAQPPAGAVPYHDGYSQQPYPGRPAYPDGYAAGGYSAGSEKGYAADPYATGGYGPYPSQG